jgi:hypothetical protein
VEGIEFGRGGGRAPMMVFAIISPRRLWRRGEGGERRQRGRWSDEIERERLREGRPLRAKGGGVGGRRVWPRRAGAEIMV